MLPFGRPALIMVAAAILFLAGKLLVSRVERGPVSNTAEQRELARSNMRILRIALNAFHADTGRYPSDAEGLAALTLDPGAPGWRGPYILACGRTRGGATLATAVRTTSPR